MDRELIAKLFRKFEALARQDKGVEYWLARDLQPLLGYAQWRNFELVLTRAREACKQAGQRVADHFADVSKMVDLGSSARRELEDIAITRYAAYLIAQNGDARKAEIAFAQTYFAIQTRKQELVEARLAEGERLDARGRLAASERRLSGVILERLQERESFARIRSRGDSALVGGWSTQDMKRRLGVPRARPLADFLPTVTIKAKDLANAMTAHNVESHDLRSERVISADHVQNNTELRRALGQRGIKPEALPPAEDIRKLSRRLESERRELPASTPSARRRVKRRNTGPTG